MLVSFDKFDLILYLFHFISYFGHISSFQGKVGDASENSFMHAVLD